MINYHQLSQEMHRLAEFNTEVSELGVIFARINKLFASFIRSPHQYYNILENTPPNKKLYAKVLQQEQKELLWPESCDISYQISAIDGSQAGPYHVITWPKHFQLLNIASITVEYGPQQSYNHHSYAVFTNTDESKQIFPSEVDLATLRSYYEFREAHQLTKSICKSPSLLLIDGSLLWWSLDNKPEQVKKNCLVLLNQFFQDAQSRQIVPLGYISGTQSSDLANCLRVIYCKQATGGDVNNQVCASCNDELCTILSGLRDEFLFEMLASDQHKSSIISPLFQSQVEDKSAYEKIPIYFFYLYLDGECVRVELPAFCHSQMSLILTCLSDQLQKGHGYPVLLSDAHELAVVSVQDKKQIELMISSYLFSIGLKMLERKKDISKGMKYV